MTAIVLPDIDRSTLEELKKRIPDLSEIELPSLPSRREVGRAAKDVSKTADATIDRLLGRSRAPMWPWIAAGVGLVALVGIVAAWFAWFRRPTWEAPAEPWTAPTHETGQTTVTAATEPELSGEDAGEIGDTTLAAPRGSTARERSRSSSSGGSTTGLSTAGSLGSAPYPIEEA
jgi:hypothetical protein